MRGHVYPSCVHDVSHVPDDMNNSGWHFCKFCYANLDSYFQVFRKSGIEKYDPTSEQFDPNRHNAVFQVPDNSKPPGTVAVVIKVIFTGIMQKLP